MNVHQNEYTTEEVLEKVDEFGIAPHIKEYLSKCIPFHTYAAPGTLIGVYMVDYALDLLGVSPDKKLFAVSETPKCLPDAAQIIAHCTTGNNRLRIVPIGRFAITINAATDGSSADGVRVYLDPKKMSRYPTLSAWFSNTPAFDGKTMKKALTDEILKAGRDMLSYERVRIPVIQKKKWNSTTCPSCGEEVPEDQLENGRCKGCGSLRYYEKI